MRKIQCFVFLLVAATGLKAGGPPMPWDSGLTIFINNLTGPLAGAVALIAIVFGGGSLLMGGEWEVFATRPDKAAHQSANVLGNSFAKPFFVVLLVLGVLLGAAQIIALFGGFGAGAVLATGVIYG